LVNKTLETCSAEDLPNFEGYVAAWRTAGKPPLRAKLKQETYLMLHRILTGLNPKTVWEMLSAGQQDKIDALFADEKIPKDFKKWLSGWATQLRDRYAGIEAEAKTVFAGKPGGTRKDDALYFQKTPHLKAILFLMFDGKSYDSTVWGMIKPRATDTFKQDE
jgi:RNA ligase